MCRDCGCQGEANATAINLQTGVRTIVETPNEQDSDGRTSHEHHADVSSQQNSGGAADEGGHSHPHRALHNHARGPAGDILQIETQILAKNDSLAAKNRAWFTNNGILALNLVSSPGSGKTTLLERTISCLANDLSLYVIEGDQATTNDGERIRAAGAPVVQVNTGTGCHLDAAMIAHGICELKPTRGSIVFIENVGNLVCPSLFDLGEDRKVVVFSTAEGEDKPLKYPHMFRAAGLVILNKIDLLPHLDFSLDRALANLRQVNPDAAMLQVSARTGEGILDWCRWIHDRIAAGHRLAGASQVASNFAPLEELPGRQHSAAGTVSSELSQDRKGR